MSKFFVPAYNPEDWKPLLAKPDKHWRTGYSTKALAYCWQERDDFPRSVRKVFVNSSIELFRNVELLLAFPEYRVPLPGGTTASQSDIFILAKGNDQLISIMVEGKVHETFGEMIVDWKLDDYGGKETRLNYLCALLKLDKERVDHIRYQLLHRTASAIIEAKRFNTRNALMMVHSFSQENEGFDDYCRFLDLFGAKGGVDSLVYASEIDEIHLYFGWVKGNQKYLKK